jgi:rhodanese-related sulfurtransferase
MGFFDLFKSSGANTEELKEIVNNNAFLVDVRSSGEFSSGSAKGAKNIPLDQINSRIDDFKGKSNIVVFCRSGNRSGKAKSILEQNGIRNVTNGGTWEQVNNLIN